MGLLSYRRAVVRNFCPSSHPIQICRRDRRAGVGRYPTCLKSILGYFKSIENKNRRWFGLNSG